MLIRVRNFFHVSVSLYAMFNRMKFTEQNLRLIEILSEKSKLHFPIQILAIIDTLLVRRIQKIHNISSVSFVKVVET